MTASLQQPIVFPDVEASLIAWLPTVVAGVPASTRVPNPRPSRWIRIMRTGGPRVGLVTDQAQVTVECWDDNIVAAADLARQVRTAIGQLGGRTAGGMQVHRVQEYSGPANLPDVHSEQPRYTWTYQLDVRGTPA